MATSGKEKAENVTYPSAVTYLPVFEDGHKWEADSKENYISELCNIFTCVLKMAISGK